MTGFPKAESPCSLTVRPYFSEGKGQWKQGRVFRLRDKLLLASLVQAPTYSGPKRGSAYWGNKAQRAEPTASTRASWCAAQQGHNHTPDSGLLGFTDQLHTSFGYRVKAKGLRGPTAPRLGCFSDSPQSSFPALPPLWRKLRSLDSLIPSSTALSLSV